MRVPSAVLVELCRGGGTDAAIDSVLSRGIAHPPMTERAAPSRCKTLAVLGFVEDLRFAQQARVAVEVTLFDGQKFFTGVHDVDEQVGIVSLYEPQTFSDATTRRRVHLADIKSVVVTEIDYTVD